MGEETGRSPPHGEVQVAGYDEYRLWDFDQVPGEMTKEFQDRINFDSHHKVYVPTDNDYWTWSDREHPLSHSSFGDQGTTASVAASGQLMQFGSYLGGGKSGIFSADQGGTREPHRYMNRARGLDELSHGGDPEVHFTYGLSTSLDQLELQKPKVTKYVHGRWPRYEYGNQEVSIKIQWTVHEGLVLQQYVAENLTNERLSVALRFADYMAIRDLDEEEPSYYFNDAYDDEASNFGKAKQLNYTSLGPNNYGWVCVHDFEPSSLDQGIAVVVNIYVDGTALKWSPNPVGNFSPAYEWSCDIQPKGATSSRSGRLEIVTAYKMIHMSSAKEDWTKFVFPATMIQQGLPPKTTFTRLSLSKPGANAANPSGIALKTENDFTEHIDFLLSRHLEHILSVCAIPIGNSTEGDFEQCMVALTCGDMSNHMISTSASFFAFRFLLEALVQLKALKITHDYAKSLENRIEWACKGHIRWLQAAQRMKSGGFASRYRINGTVLAETGTDINLTDTAFQIIKLTDYIGAFPATDEARVARDLAGSVCISWLTALANGDKRGKYAWRHADGGGFGTFRLDDHIWLYESLKGLEARKIWDGLRGTDGSAEYTKSPVFNLAKKFRSDDVLLQIITRFTTRFLGSIETDERIRKPLPRVLAVTRSLRDNRVLFHARDTALFYCQDLEKQSGDRWKQSIKVQALYEEYENSDWDNALRFGLAVVMGTRGHSIRGDVPAQQIQSAVEVLIQSANSNGFFAGQLDSKKKPMLYTRGRHRDFYFHASFEIPFILLTDARKIYDSFGNNTGKQQGHVASVGLSAPPVSQVPTQVAAVSSPEPLDSRTLGSVKVEKRFVSPDHVFDAKNIVKLDEEWLYNYPPFLERDEDVTALSVIGLCYEQDKMSPPAHPSVVEKGVQSLRRTGWWKDIKSRLEIFLQTDCGVRTASWGDVQQHIETKSWKGLEPYLEVMSETRPSAFEPFYPFRDNCRAEVIDIRKHDSSRTSKNKNDNHADRQLCGSSGDLWYHLKQPRTASMSKKRLVWLSKITYEAALVSFLGVPDGSKISMAQFFDRHANCEVHFNEEILKTLNVWETEFLVSFYRLTDYRSCTQETSTASGFNPIELTMNDGKVITRGAIGFRFDGDVFDRYWTCHCIENIPGYRILDEDRPIALESLVGIVGERSWAQRRILELKLLRRMITHVVNDTTGIITAVKNETQITPWNTLKVHDKMTGAQWQTYEHVMQLIQDNVESCITAISSWEKAEHDRSIQGLRWTSKDERKYRSTIIQLRIIVRKRIEELRLTKERVVSLRTNLTATKDRIRNDQEFQGSENLRYFTYVTVVFLPLGFATSIYSMSEYPDGALIQSMSICAIAALLITLLTLFNAKPLANVFHDWSTFSSRTKKRSYVSGRRISESRPILANTSATLQDLERARSWPRLQGGGQRAHQPALPGMASLQTDDAKKNTLKTWPLWFWLTYVFLELPARQVLMAYLVLKRWRLHTETSGAGAMFLAKLGKSVVQVASGIMFLPVFIASWILRWLCYNILDMLSLLGRIVSQTFAIGDKEAMEDYAGRIESLLSPENMRPWRSR